MFIKYEGNSAGNVHLLRSGGETWLRDFADELVANKSFAELLRTSGLKYEKSLDALPGYNLYPKPVESPGRYINAPGMQEVAIKLTGGIMTIKRSPRRCKMGCKQPAGK